MFYRNSHLRLTQKTLLIKCREMQMPRGNVIGFGLVLVFYLFGLSSHLGLSLISALLNALKFL